MSVFPPEPLETCAPIENAGADIKLSEKIEKYRISDKAVYIPCGLKWQYLPLSEIKAVNPAINLVTAESCSGFEAQLPALRVEYGGEKLYMEFNKKDAAEKMKSKLTK